MAALLDTVRFHCMYVCVCMCMYVCMYRLRLRMVTFINVTIITL